MSQNLGSLPSSHNVTLRRPPPSLLTCDVIYGCSLRCWQHWWNSQKLTTSSTTKSPSYCEFKCVIRPTGTAVSASRSTRTDCTSCRSWSHTCNCPLPRYPIYRHLYPCSISARRDTNLYTSLGGTSKESMGLLFRGTLLWRRKTTPLRDLPPPRCRHRRDAPLWGTASRLLEAPTVRPLQQNKYTVWVYATLKIIVRQYILKSCFERQWEG